MSSNQSNNHPTFEAAQQNLIGNLGLDPWGRTLALRTDSLLTRTDASLPIRTDVWTNNFGNEPSTNDAGRRAVFSNGGGYAAYHNESQVYQPAYPPLAGHASGASAPAYSMEYVTVGPGVQVLKKKFLPRYLPMTTDTHPMAGRGRPILGRGSELYDIAPRRKSPPAIAPSQTNENDFPHGNGATGGDSSANRDQMSAAVSVPMDRENNPWTLPQEQWRWSSSK